MLDLSGVLDLTEPYEITRLGEARADGERGADFYLSTFTLSGELVYGFDTFGEFGHCRSNTFTIDISDPARPVFEPGGEGLPGFTCAGLAQAVGERLYVPDWDGLHLLDLSDPLRPQPLGLFPALPGSASLVPYLGEYLYWASHRSDTSLHLLDLRDPAAPAAYGTLAPGWTYGSAISGSYLIAPAGFNGLQVIDLADPFQPQVTALIPADLLGGPVYVTVAESYAYVNVEGDRLVIVELRDPLQPVIAGQYGPSPAIEPQVYVNAVAISRPYAYFAESQERDRQERTWLRVLDVSDPANPQAMGKAAVPGQVQLTSRPALSEGMAYLPTRKGIAVVDVGNPNNPQAVGWLDLPGGALDAAFSGPYLLVAGGQAGLWVADVSHPAQPVLVGRYDTPGTCFQEVVVSEAIYVDDGPAGALLLKIRLK